MDPTLCFTQTIESESKVAQDYLASEKHKMFTHQTALRLRMSDTLWTKQTNKRAATSPVQTTNVHEKVDQEH